MESVQNPTQARTSAFAATISRAITVKSASLAQLKLLQVSDSGTLKSPVLCTMFLFNLSSFNVA